MKPGIYPGLSNDAYHLGDGVSKTGLWTIHTQTPAHYKYPPKRDENSTQALAVKDMGNAIHIAILEPNRFEAAVYRGPDDRRGNKWTDAVEFCNLESKLLLTGPTYDEVLAIRDATHSDPWLNSIITGGKPMIEASAYWEDEETGALCRCRPDFYREDLGVIIDLKSTRSAHPDAFAKSVISYGYHAQEAHYTTGWEACGKDVNGFIFLATEKLSPYARALYELPPSIVMEGRQIIRKALNTYHECFMRDEWPGFIADPNKPVTELQFKRWHYTETEAPDGEE